MMRLYFDPKTHELFDDRNRNARKLLSPTKEHIVRNECMRRLQRGALGRVFCVALPKRVALQQWVVGPATPHISFHKDVVEIVVKDRREVPLRALPEVRSIRPAFSGRFDWMREAFERDFLADALRPEKGAAFVLIDTAAAAEKPQVEPQQASSKWRDGEHFIAHLLKRGFEKIGAGCYSTVLAKPGSDRVVKVSRQIDNWLDYVVWAAKRGHAGKFAPVVHSYRVVQGKHDKFYVAVVERLKQTLSSVEFSHRETYRAYEKLRRYMDGGNENAGIDADLVLPGGLRFAMDFKRNFRGRFDLHANNWMVRKDGSVVCTDPLTTGNTSSTTAPKAMRSRDFAQLSCVR